MGETLLLGRWITHILVYLPVPKFCPFHLLFLYTTKQSLALASWHPTFGYLCTLMLSRLKTELAQILQPVLVREMLLQTPHPLFHCSRDSLPSNTPLPGTPG